MGYVSSVEDARNKLEDIFKLEVEDLKKAQNSSSNLTKVFYSFHYVCQVMLLKYVIINITYIIKE